MSSYETACGQANIVNDDNKYRIIRIFVRNVFNSNRIDRFKYFIYISNKVGVIGIVRIVYVA